MLCPAESSMVQVQSCRDGSSVAWTAILSQKGKSLLSFHLFPPPLPPPQPGTAPLIPPHPNIQICQQIAFPGAKVHALAALVDGAHLIKSGSMARAHGMERAGPVPAGKRPRSGSMLPFNPLVGQFWPLLHLWNSLDEDVAPLVHPNEHLYS